MEFAIDLSDRLVCDLEMILMGAFSPLEGFLNSKDYKSVVKNMRLTSGELWPMPIVLPISETMKNKIMHEEHILLKNSTNLPLARLFIDDIYKPDIELECQKVYGTTDKNHPYVRIVQDYGQNVWYVGGRVEKINGVSHFDFVEDRLTPDDTKIFFRQNKWKTVVGFQTRNPMHRSHLELTKYALNKTNDPDAKLLLQPIVGVTQKCDVDYHTRVRCYKRIIKKYPEDTAKLCLLPLSMRMAGPREALWHALIRRNFGCTHFVVGRDHAGPSSKTKDGEPFYGPYDAHNLLESVKDEIGIKIIKSKMIVYVKDLNDYMPIDEVPDGMETLSISGTEQRRRLKEGEEIPEWFSYPDIVSELRKSYLPNHKKGFCIYLVGLSGSGKTTIGNSLMFKLKEVTHRRITVLDGDIVRKHLSRGLGFSREDRSINVRRIGFVASEIVKHGGIVICANIAPYKEDRDHNREFISSVGGYIEVFVDTPISVCEKRDVKGLYKLARKGIIKEFTGISDPFEIPENSEIVVANYNSLADSVNLIMTTLYELGYLI